MGRLEYFMRLCRGNGCFASTIAGHESEISQRAEDGCTGHCDEVYDQIVVLVVH
jgi:hypothetical protein